MARPVRWSFTAASELEEICAYIGKDSPHYASLFAERILAATRRAGQFPQFGRIVPEYDDPAIREVIYQGYRVVYRLSGEAVEITQICHGAKPLREEYAGDR